MIGPVLSPRGGPALDAAGGLSRRALGRGVLAGTVVAGLATGLVACTEDSPDPGAPAEDPDAALATEVVEALDALLLLHSATAAAHPRLARRLDAVRAAHEDHRAAVVEAAAAGTGVDVPPVAPTTGATPPAVSPRPRAALSAVVIAEADAAEEFSRLAFRALSGPFARLLAAMAASSHQHALALSPAAAGAPDGGSA